VAKGAGVMSKITQRKKALRAAGKGIVNPPVNAKMVTMKSEDIRIAARGAPYAYSVTFRFGSNANPADVGRLMTMMSHEFITMDRKHQLIGHAVSESGRWENSDNRIFTFSPTINFPRNLFDPLIP
jgi:hypothetical protein